MKRFAVPGGTASHRRPRGQRGAQVQDRPRVRRRRPRGQLVQRLGVRRVSCRSPRRTRAGSRTIPSKVNFGNDVQIKYLEPKAGGQDREILMRALAEDGYQLIYGVGFLFSDALAKVAKDFPDIHFGLIDGYIPDLNESSNITCLGFKENEGSFLVGAIAALKAKGKPIGFLGGMDIPLIHRFENGFDAGAMYVNKAYRAPGHDHGPVHRQGSHGIQRSHRPATTSPPTSTSRAPRSSSTPPAARATACSRRRRKPRSSSIGVDSDQGTHLRRRPRKRPRRHRPSSSSPR